MRDAQVDFSYGQLSPRTSGRVDLDFHRSGALEMTNFIALPQGPAEARPGMIRIDDYDQPDLAHRLVAMAIDHTTSILLVVNAERIYAYDLLQDGSIVSAVPILDDSDQKIWAPLSYFEKDLFDLQFVPYEGQLYISHPNYEAKVVSFDPTALSLSIKGFAAEYRKYSADPAVSYDAGDTVYYEGKIYRALIDTPGELAGETEVYYEGLSSETLYPLEKEAGNAIPTWADTMTTRGMVAVHESSVWLLGTKEEADKDGNYRCWWYPTAVPEDENGVKLWDLCDSRLMEVENTARKPDHPADPSGLAWMHVCDLPLGTGSLPYWDAATEYEVGQIFHYLGGVFRVVRDTTATPPPPDEKSSGFWVYVADAPTFGTDGHYPNLITFHDRRMYILGTFKHPGTLYASEIGRTTNFTMGLRDDQGFQIELSTEVAELPTWARSRRDLIVGSAKSEWIITGGQGPITPTSLFAFPQSRSGAMRNGAIDISDMVVFLQKGGQRLLRFVFSNDTQSYITPDMTQLSHDIFLSGVREFALQSNPDFILWCVMNDGTLVGGTYNPVTQAFGWHKHDTDGDIESVAVTTSDIGEDEVWFSIRRDTANGSERQLERLAFREQADKGAEMIYLDDAEVIAINEGVGYVSPDKYGETLQVLYGGAAHPDVVADETGKVEFQHELFDTAVVGRAYFPKLRPQRLDPGGSQLDMGMRISRAAIRVYKTLGISVGADEDHLNPIQFRSTSGIMGQAPPLFTGEIQTSVDSSFGDENFMLIIRDQPFPCMILGVTYELEVGGI